MPPLDPKQSAFLTAYANCANVTRAAKKVGITRQTVWNWRQDPDFQRAFEVSRKLAIEALEDVAHEVAFSGDARLIIFLLKSLKPEQYAEEIRVNMNDLTDDEILRTVNAGKLRNRSG